MLISKVAILELFYLFLFSQRSHSRNRGAIIRITPVGPTGPCFPSTSHLISFGPWALYVSSQAHLVALFFCLFLCIKKIFFACFFFFFSFLREEDWGGESHCQLIERHFHQVFLNYHVGSQPLLCKLYLKKNPSSAEILLGIVTNSVSYFLWRKIVLWEQPCLEL